MTVKEWQMHWPRDDVHKLLVQGWSCALLTDVTVNNAWPFCWFRYVWLIKPQFSCNLPLHSETSPLPNFWNVSEHDNKVGLWWLGMLKLVLTHAVDIMDRFSFSYNQLSSSGVILCTCCSRRRRFPMVSAMAPVMALWKRWCTSCLLV